MACRMVLALVLALFLATPAAARAPVPPPPDLTAALDAARTPAAISMARTNLRQVHGTEPTTISIADRGIPAYVLNPDFVRGVPGAPAGVLQYIAVTATAGSGDRVTLRASQDPTGAWGVDSAFSGNDEEVLSARLAPGSVLLNEPQINGWYELKPAGVVLLQASLPQSPVGTLIPLADYQTQVGTRYGETLSPKPPPAESSWTAPVVVTAAALLVAFVLFRRLRSA
ncbi:hypothetical protein [Actinokineospora diospyrosa]|uniref:LPXTG-motif cell wall-anchored protein n=1 Tax=Actinokineospora diospyrosa TaxID=103728 RepID=A0ABT1IFW0_9PSEU|nr:hypothetical protein [Actinokineospora diospyrosa]MCP2271540.1 hypothetical protein [Actinokineospora diospyrosa]